MEIRPEFKKKPIRSYVIRAGRITEGQKKAFRQYWPEFGLRLEDGQLEPEKIFILQQPLVVEVGFGMGDSLLAMAMAEPEKNFIGIEVHAPGVGRLLSAAADKKLANLRIYMADAVDVLQDCFADNSISRFQLYFPDPWHKKKHHKRRIVQPAFLDLIASRMSTGGIVHFATDWQPYAEQMMELLESSDSLMNCAGLNHYAERPGFRPATKFEQRGERLGHGVWDLLFQKQ